jgi:hypothetical protein
MAGKQSKEKKSIIAAIKYLEKYRQTMENIPEEMIEHYKEYFGYVAYANNYQIDSQLNLLTEIMNELK